MNLLEVGALLKRERERRGISIRDVMDMTKISRRNLTALEEGQVKSLPHPVYLKGYVRNIARMVGLDADELAKVVDQQYDAELAKYLPVAPEVAAPPLSAADAQAAPGAEQEHSASLSQASAPERETWRYHAPEALVALKAKSGGAWRSLVALLVLVGVLAALLVQYQRMYTEAPSAPVLAAPPVDNAANATAQDNATNATAQDNATLEAPQPEHFAPAVLPVAAPAPRAPAAATFSLPPASVELPRKASASGMQSLTVTAKDNEVCWVEVFDGQQAKSFTLRNGESRQVEFVSRMRVRLGNAGGVSFRLNGRDHPYEGKRGSLDTLEFGSR